MKQKTRIAAMLLCMALLLTGCGQTTAEQSAAETAQTAQSAAAETGDTAGTTQPEAGENTAAAASAAEEEDFVIPDIDVSVPADQECTASVFAMDTLMDMKAYGPGAQEALDVITDEISALEATLSVTAEGSEIYALNHADGQPTAVSDTTRELLERAIALGDTTGNALDVSIYPVLTAWGFTTQEYRIPDNDEIQTLLKNVDDNQIVFDDAAGTVTVPAGMEVDLGSVVKGYTGDRAVEILQACGVSSALINLGGSTIRCLGSKLDGSDWKVAIQDPEDTESYAGILAISDCAVDTSGGYERYFLDDEGNVYWHIIDPATGYPAKNGLISATIISGDSFTGDGLSTAAFVMGLDKTIEYWRENGGFEFVLITDEGEIYASDGIADSFTPYGAYEGKEVHVVTFEENAG